MASAQVVETSVTNKVLLRTLITQMIFFNQGMLLLGSNHFLIVVMQSLNTLTPSTSLDRLPRVMFSLVCTP